MACARWSVQNQPFRLSPVTPARKAPEYFCDCGQLEFTGDPSIEAERPCGDTCLSRVQLRTTRRHNQRGVRSLERGRSGTFPPIDTSDFDILEPRFPSCLIVFGRMTRIHNLD